MSRFEYDAQNGAGAAISGRFAAADGAAAMEQLTAMGLTNIELRELPRDISPVPLGRDEFAFFNEQLAGLAAGGMGLDQGLRQLARDIRSRRLRKALDEMADDIDRGEPLEKVLAARAPTLPALYGAVVRMGVVTGKLSEVLLNLSGHLRVISDARRSMREALAYPFVILGLTLALFATVITIVMPQFAVIFNEFRFQRPPITDFMIALSSILPYMLIVAVVVALACALVYIALRRTAFAAAAVERLVMAAPLLGVVLRNSLRSRFLRSLALAIDAGLPLPDAVRLASGATGSPMLSREGIALAEHIEGGASITAIPRRFSLLPGMLGCVVGASESTGTLGHALDQLAEAYAARSAQGQLNLRLWLAPTALIAVGAFIGLVIFGLFWPMVQILSLLSSVTG